MDFASVSTLGKTIFSTTDSGLNWLYSGSLATVVFMSLLFSWVMETWKESGNWTVTGIGTFANIIAAWLRWYCIKEGSYFIAMVSSFFLGVAGASIIVSIVPLAKYNFSTAQRTLATTIAVQLNYAGWCVGSFIIPSYTSNKEDFENLMYLQAIIASFGLLLFVSFHRPRPTFCCECTGRRDKDNSYRNRKKNTTPLIADNSEANTHLISEKVGLVELLSNANFVIQGMSFAVLGGISFAIPAVQDEIFSEVGLNQDLTKWTNVTFVLSGVVSGLLLGAWFHYRGIEPTSQTSMRVLRAMFVICTISLTVLACATYAADSFDREVFTVLLFVSMLITGACCLGFVGIALSQAVAVAYPASEVYSASFVEWLIQIWGVIFAQLCAGSGNTSGSSAPSPGSLPNGTQALPGNDNHRNNQHSVGFIILAGGCFFATLGLFCSSPKPKTRGSD